MILHVANISHGHPYFVCITDGDDYVADGALGVAFMSGGGWGEHFIVC